MEATSTAKYQAILWDMQSDHTHLSQMIATTFHSSLETDSPAENA